MDKGLHIKLVISLLCLLMTPMIVFAVEPCFDTDITDEVLRFDDCKKRAEQSDIEAQSRLGSMYYHGDGTDKNYNEAFKWLNKVIEAKHLVDMEAQFLVAEMYHKGLGVKQNNLKAYAFYFMAANSGTFGTYVSTSSAGVSESAIHSLTNEMTVVHTQQAIIFALEYLRQSEITHGVPSGDPFALWIQAEMYKNKNGYDSLVSSIYSAAAYLGYGDAQRLLVTMVQEGDILYVEDRVTEEARIKEQAEKNEIWAQLDLGFMYLHGVAVKQNSKLALEWFKTASQIKPLKGKENSIIWMASYLAGWMYDTGQGIEQDYKQAFEWYKKAADAGYGDAQLRLAEMYQHGLGIEQNNQLAIEWYQTAAEQNYHKAQRVLAKLYRTGTLLKQDSKLAFEWYKKAAVLEDLPAQYALAEMYYQGEGTAKDDNNAYLFSDYLAQQYSHVEATKLREQIKKDMTSEQLETATTLQQQWLHDAKYRTLGVAVEPPFEW